MKEACSIIMAPDALEDKIATTQWSGMQWDAKLELLLAGQQRVQTQQQQLKQLVELSQFINTEPIQGDTSISPTTLPHPSCRSAADRYPASWCLWEASPADAVGSFSTKQA